QSGHESAAQTWQENRLDALDKSASPQSGDDQEKHRSLEEEQPGDVAHERACRASPKAIGERIGSDGKPDQEGEKDGLAFAMATGRGAEPRANGYRRRKAPRR